MIKRHLQGPVNLLRRLALLWAVGFLPCTAIADTPFNVLNRLSTPAGAEVQIVTLNSVSNGMPVAIATLRSTDNTDSVFGFYRHYWSNGENDKQLGFVESDLPGWSLMSRLHEGFSVVIQLRTDIPSGASGFISVMAVNRPRLEQNHPDFDGLKLLSSNRSVDGVDTSSMHVYASSLSVSNTYQLYRQKLVSKRWQLLSDNKVDGAQVLIFVRDQSRLEVSVVESSEYGSVLVAHQVTSE